MIGTLRPHVYMVGNARLRIKARTDRRAMALAKQWRASSALAIDRVAPIRRVSS